jgi:hypothetical protein
MQALLLVYSKMAGQCLSKQKHLFHWTAQQRIHKDACSCLHCFTAHFYDYSNKNNNLLLTTTSHQPPAKMTTDLSRNRSLYPEFAVFMTALQDPGKEDTKSKTMAYTYPKILKLSGKIYDILKAASFPYLNANKSRTCREIMKIIVMARKHVDLVDVNPVFHPFATADDKVFIVSNDVEYWGFDSVLTTLSRHFSVKAIQRQDDRNPGDAVRVAAVMLHPDHQGAVTGILKGVKDRAKADQSVDPTHAWAMQAVRTFQDPDFQVKLPDDINPEDVDGVDPNDRERLSIPRDGKWFLDTWRYYLKRKYKSAIGRWDKETGGGSHEPHEFANFCERGSRWLVWVYMMDLENNFLLFSNAKGKPPCYVGREAGFEYVDSGHGPTDFSSDDNNGMPCRGGTLPRVSLLSSVQKRRKTNYDEARKLFENKTNTLESLMKEMASTLKASQPYIGQDVVGGTILQSIIEAGKKKEDLERYTIGMSGEARDAVMAGIFMEIENLSEQYRIHLERRMAARNEGVREEDCEGGEDEPGGSRTIRNQRQHQLDPDSSSEDENESNSD